MNTRTKIDYLEKTGDACLEISKWAVIAIGFGAFIQTDRPIGWLLLIALAFALAFAAIAFLCFYLYNRNNNKSN